MKMLSRSTQFGINKKATQLDKKIFHLTQNFLTQKISINISLSFLAISELPCETDGFAGNYDEDQATTPCNHEGN